MGKDHKGYVVLITKPNDPALYGPVEHSFSLSVQVNETQYWWGAKDYWGPGKHIDALQRAQDSLAYWKKDHPDWQFQLLNSRDLFLPIRIDWKTYDWASKHDPTTLSGVRDKHRARNLSFKKRFAIMKWRGVV